MALTITEPIKTVNGLLTKALAADTQLLYTMQRKDNDISISTGPGNFFIIPGVDATSSYSGGDSVYLGLDTREDSGIYTLVSVSFSSPDTLLEVASFADTGNDTGYINNRTTRENYRVNLEIRDEADTLSILDTPFTYIPNQAGLLDLDVSAIVSFYMRDIAVFSFSYFMRITEVWQGSSESSVDTTVLQALLAQKQLLSVGGANMWENLLRVKQEANFSSINDNGGLVQLVLGAGAGDVTGAYSSGNFVDVIFNGGGYTDGVYVITASEFPAANTLVTIDTPFIVTTDGMTEIPNSTGKFLTKFKNPLLWVGWNRLIAYLVDSELFNRIGGGGEHRFSSNDVDINKNNVTGNRIISIDNDPVRVQLVSIFPDNVSPNAEFIEIDISNTSNTAKFTETIYYKIQSEYTSPIMLDWLNGIGGVDQWLFEVQQSATLENDEGIVVEAPVTTDIENIVRTKRRFANTFRQQLTLKAENLTIDQLLALQEIKKTESLRVYLSKDGAKFIDGIVVNDFSSPYSTKDNTHKFTVIIELPDGFIFENGKVY